MPASDPSPDDAWTEALNALLTAERRSADAPARSAAYLSARATLMARRRIAPPPTSVSGGLAPWQADRVRAYVEANLTETMPRQRLAALTRLSASSFARAFKMTFGCPPHAFVVSRRIERARHLMRSTELPLSVVALDSGFADQAHFCRLFRRHIGWSPAAWRRANADLERPNTAATAVAESPSADLPPLTVSEGMSC